MARNEYRPAVPEDWFVDPVRLGVPGIRSARPTRTTTTRSPGRPTRCARRPIPRPSSRRRADRRATRRRSAPRARSRPSASSTRCRTTSGSASGAGSPSASAASCAARAPPSRVAAHLRVPRSAACVSAHPHRRDPPPSLGPMQPRVTAILVVRNGEEWLDRTLPALAAQTRRPDDFVLVDAASSDGSAARLAGAGPTRFVTAPGAAVRRRRRARPARARARPSRRTSGSGCSPPTPRPSRVRSSDCSRPSRSRRPSRSPAPSSSTPTIRRPLLSYGESISRFGATVRLVDDELDQAQHDADGDVLGGDRRRRCSCAASVWTELGGFDPGPADDRRRPRLLDPRAARRRPRGPRRRTPGSRAARARGLRPPPVPRPTAARVRARAHRAAAPPHGLRAGRRAALPLALAACRSRSCARSGTCSRKRPSAIGGELASGVRAPRSTARCPPRAAACAAPAASPWAAIAPLRVPSDELRERRAAAARARLRRRPTSPSWCAPRSSPAAAPGSCWSPRSPDSGCSGGCCRRRRSRGGALLPLGGDVGALWTQPRLGPREGAVGLDRRRPTRSPPCSPCSAASRSWNPSFSLVLLWLTALPLAALGAWWCATRLSERRWPPIVAALLWTLAPPLLAALERRPPDRRARAPAAAVAGARRHREPPLVERGRRPPRCCSPRSSRPAPVLAPALRRARRGLGGRQPARRSCACIGISIPAIALFAPLVVWQLCAARRSALLADPGPGACPSGAVGLAAAARACRRRPTTGWAAIGTALGLPARDRSPRRSCSPRSRCVALLAVFLPGARRAIPALVVALAGLVTAVAAAHVARRVVGRRPRHPVGRAARLSLYWLGLIGAAVVALDALGARGVADRARGAADRGAPRSPRCSSPRCSAPPPVEPGATAAAARARRGAEPTPIRASARSCSTPQHDGSLAATIARDVGTTLDETSTLVTTRRSTCATRMRALAELAGNLASRSGFDPDARARRSSGSRSSLVPAAATTRPDRSRRVRQRTTEALDATPVLTPDRRARRSGSTTALERRRHPPPRRAPTAIGRPHPDRAGRRVR